MIVTSAKASVLGSILFLLLCVLFLLNPSARSAGSWLLRKIPAFDDLGNASKQQPSGPSAHNVSTSKPKTGSGWTPTSAPPYQDDPVDGYSIQDFVNAILDPADEKITRLTCPLEIGERYTHLKTLPPGSKYYFALDLHQAALVLPRLMCSLVSTITYLGPANCVLSIVEGRSTDRTYDILQAVKPHIEQLGISFHLHSSAISPPGTSLVNDTSPARIAALAALRNLALAPLLTSGPDASLATIIFLNDIVLCPDDILELLHQQTGQNATQTCAFDWIGGGRVFYDSWISRSMSGDTFFPILQDGDDWEIEKMFVTHPESRKRFESRVPLQVFSCWGGMTVLDAAVFALPEGKGLRFRASREGDCPMGEPLLLGMDLWRVGRGRMLAVPAVNVGYGTKNTKAIKKMRGYVGDHVDVGMEGVVDGELVEWVDTPPQKVVCIPDWKKHVWVNST